MDFLGFAQTCGPTVDPVTTTAMVKAESSFNPLAIRDNTAKVSFSPRNWEAAESIILEQSARGHRLAIGLMQITTPWAARLRIKPAALLDACTNIAIGTSILADNYRACATAARSPESTLTCALSMYWSGNGRTGGAYVNRIFRTAGSPLRVPEVPGVTDGILGSSLPPPVVPEFRRFYYRTQVFSYSNAPRPDFEFSNDGF
jgi:type IV secretion system protein VirB1